VNVSEIVIGQLAFFSFREGQRLSPGSRPAMLGIAHCIRNRVEAGWSNGEWLKIIAEAPIHASSDVKEMDFHSYVDIWDQSFRWLYGQCSAVYDGSLKDEITVSADPKKAGVRGVPQRALFYGNIQMAVRHWFWENIVIQPSEHPRTATAGAVIFFA
jgi:hypothetical protein